MAEFFLNYGLFLAKAATIVVAILVVIGSLFFLAQKEKALEQIQVRNLNKKFKEMGDAIKHHSLSKKLAKKIRKEAKAEEKRLEKVSDDRKRLFVIDFEGDIRASAVSELREEISAILAVAKASDEVVVRIESSGGMVHSYGLAASQLHRVRKAGIPLVVTIDKVAASGGYMMACVANRILAAPFAIVGSIGVLAQVPNFHRLLKKHDVDFEQFTAGAYKRTISIFGENTESGKKKFLEQMEETHVLFKTFVKEHRPQVDIETVATGEHWFATQALKFSLIDELTTSDDYLLESSKQSDVLLIAYKARKKLSEKLSSALQSAWDKILFTAG